MTTKTIDLTNEIAGKNERQATKEWHKKYPKAGKSSWKYFLFNTVHWEE